MTKVVDIYNAIDRIAPFNSAMDFDNVGLMVGDMNAPVKRVIVSLDITDDVIDEALSKNVNLIIGHHPLIFDPLKSLKSTDIPYKLASCGISAISAHTNLDMSPSYGVNVALGKKLGLTDIRGELEYGEGYIIFSGKTPREMTSLEFIAYVKKALSSDVVRAYASTKPVNRVFFTSGAGANYGEDARCLGADAFLTGEIHLHEELTAARNDFTTIAAGHFETEKPFAELLISYLQKEFPAVGFIPSVNEVPPFHII